MTENKQDSKPASDNVHCVKRFELPPSSIQHYLTTGCCFEIIEGIPLGADMVRCTYDTERDVIVLVMRHPSFPPVEEGHIIPAAYVTVHQHWQLHSDPLHTPPNHTLTSADAHKSTESEF